MAQLVTDLLSDCRLAATLEGTDPDWPDATILRFANQASRSDMVPQVIRIGGEYYVTSRTYVMAANTAVFGHFLRLPDRTYGPIMGVSWVNSSGIEQELRGTTRTRLIHQGANMENTGTPCDYWIEAGKLGIYPRPNQGAIRVRYNAIPFPMSSTATYTEITAIEFTDPTTVQYTVSPSFEWAEDSGVYLMSSAEPHGLLDYIPDATLPTPGAQTTFTVPYATTWPWATANRYPGMAQVGDLVINAELSPLVQVPVELYQALVRRTCALCLLSTYEYDAARAMNEGYTEAMRAGLVMLQDRVLHQAEVYENVNSPMLSAFGYSGYGQ